MSTYVIRVVIGGVFVLGCNVVDRAAWHVVFIEREGLA